MKTLIVAFTLALTFILNAFGDSASKAPTEPIHPLKPGRYIVIFIDQTISGKTSEMPDLTPLIVDISQKGKDTIMTREDDPSHTPVNVELRESVANFPKETFYSITFGLVVTLKLESVTRYLNFSGQAAFDNNTTKFIPNAFRGPLARLDVYDSGNAQSFIGEFLLYPIDKKSEADKSADREPPSFCLKKSAFICAICERLCFR